MKLVLIGLLVLSTLFGLTGMTPAHPANGPIMIKDWYKECTANPKETYGAMKQIVCMRYVRGVADGLTLWQILDPNTAPICIPQSVDAKQLTEVGKKYFRENPKDQHIEAAVFLGLAFKDAWPCETTSPTVNFK